MVRPTQRNLHISFKRYPIISHPSRRYGWKRAETHLLMLHSCRCWKGGNVLKCLLTRQKTCKTRRNGSKSKAVTYGIRCGGRFALRLFVSVCTLVLQCQFLWQCPRLLHRHQHDSALMAIKPAKQMALMKLNDGVFSWKSAALALWHWSILFSGVMLDPYTPGTDGSLERTTLLCFAGPQGLAGCEDQRHDACRGHYASTACCTFIPISCHCGVVQNMKVKVLVVAAVLLLLIIIFCSLCFAGGNSCI